jgi:hypothetical protein
MKYRWCLKIKSEGNILIQRKPREKARILKRDGDAPADAMCRRVVPAPHRSIRRLLQSTQHAQQARFADAAWPRMLTVSPASRVKSNVSSTARLSPG